MSKGRNQAIDWPRSLTGMGASLLVMALAVFIRFLLDPFLHDDFPVVTLYGPVAFAVWVGGFPVAAIVSIVGYFACHYLFIVPRYSLAFDSSRALIGFLAYLTTCAVIIGFGEALRRTHNHLVSILGRREQPFPPTSPSEPSVLRQLKLQDPIVLGFLSLASVLAIGGVLGYLNAQRLKACDEELIKTHESQNALSSVLSALKDVETGQRGYMLTRDEQYLLPYENSFKAVDAHILGLKQLLADNPAQLARLEELKRKAESKLEEVKGVVTLSKDGNHAAALERVRTNVGNQIMQEVRAEVGTMQEAARSELKELSRRIEKNFDIAGLAIVLPAIIGIALLAAVFLLNQRNVAQRKRAAELLSDQRERLRVTLASIGDGVIATDLGGKVSFLNPVAESLTGWSLEEATGQPLQTVFHIVNEETRAPVANPALRALREGVVVGLANHTVLIRKDGGESPIDDSAAPIRDGQDRIVGSVLVFRDIAERRKLERESAERAASARRLASIVESSGDAIVHKSLDGEIQAWNAAAERLFGYAAEEAIGKPGSIVIPTDRSEEEQRILKRLLAGELVSHFHTVRQHKSGRPIDVSLCLSPVLNDEGQIIGISKIVRDITEEKQAERQIYALMAELKEVDRRKDQFLATLAHELRGPLAPLCNTLEILKHADVNGDTLQKASSIMDRQLGQLVRLVDDLLDVSRITSNKLELRRERIELANVLHQAIDICRPIAEKLGHEIFLNLGDEKVLLYADPIRLAQIFGNLLNNACKYTEPNGRISVTSERQGSDVVVVVKDSGIGIPPRMLPRVFDMFIQVDDNLERAQGGLGIGLALAKQLVEMHEGSIEARSAGSGEGSEFVVRLPILVESKPSSRPVGPIGSRMSSISRRILVVDDNKDSAQTLAQLLRLTGHETQVAHDGLGAVAAAGEFQPDVVLLDIGLPKLNGFEACRSIREHDWGKGMVMVALTGWGQEEDRRKSKDAGFDHHLVKPVDYPTLMKLLGDTSLLPA